MVKNPVVYAVSIIDPDPTYYYLDKGWFWTGLMDEKPTPPSALCPIKDEHSQKEALDLIYASQDLAAALSLSDSQVTEVMRLIPEAQKAEFFQAANKFDMQEVTDLLLKGNLSGARFYCRATTDSILDWIGAKVSRRTRLKIWDNIGEGV